MEAITAITAIGNQIDSTPVPSEPRQKDRTLGLTLIGGRQFAKNIFYEYQILAGETCVLTPHQDARTIHRQPDDQKQSQNGGKRLSELLASQQLPEGEHAKIDDPENNQGHGDDQPPVGWAEQHQGYQQAASG